MKLDCFWADSAVLDVVLVSVVFVGVPYGFCGNTQASLLSCLSPNPSAWWHACACAVGSGWACGPALRHFVFLAMAFHESFSRTRSVSCKETSEQQMDDALVQAVNDAIVSQAFKSAVEES